MMVFCLIVGCGNKTGKRRPNAGKLSFFRVPRVIVNQGGYMEELTVERRRRLISAIRRGDLTYFILDNGRGCSEHFVSGKAAEDWDRFNVEWVPTLCLAHSKKQSKDPEEAAQRAQRATERRKRRAEAVEKELEEKRKNMDESGEKMKKYFLPRKRLWGMKIST